jgi:tyrosine aminotransferase
MKYDFGIMKYCTVYAHRILLAESMESPDDTGSSWKIRASAGARASFNPIAHLVANLKMAPNPSHKMISLAMGDPTAMGNLGPPPEAVAAVLEAVASGRYNGYGPSSGSQAGRQAVAEHVSLPGGEVVLAEHVLLCSGCSSALDMAIFTLAEAGQNILIPRPGFPLYATLAAGYGISSLNFFYNIYI